MKDKEHKTHCTIDHTAKLDDGPELDPHQFAELVKRWGQVYALRFFSRDSLLISRKKVVNLPGGRSSSSGKFPPELSPELTDENRVNLRRHF